jgi:protein phosphatase
LSDRQLVESSWQDYADRILQTEMPLEEAVQSWLALAHRENGDDNISLILMSCHVSKPDPSNNSPQLAPVRVQSPLARSDRELVPRFRFNRAINLFLWLTTGIGLLAAAAIALTFFNPSLLEKWQQPGSPSAELNQ